MKQKIFWKIFGGQLIITMITSLLIIAFSFSAIRSFYIRTVERNLIRQGEIMKPEVVALLEADRIDDLKNMVLSIGERIPVRITVVRRDGFVLADSEEDPDVMEDHQFRPEVLRALGGEIGTSSRLSRTLNRKMFYIGIPIVRKGEIVEVLRLSMFAEDIREVFTDIRSDIALIFGVMVLLSILAVLILSRSISRPLQLLTEASRRIGAGKFETRVYLDRRDEVGELAKSFNFMTEHIKQLFTDLTRRRDELNTVLDAMDEGLVVLDGESRIRLCNKSFKKIAGRGEIADKYQWEIIREKDFTDYVKNMLQEKRGGVQEIAIRDKIYQCNGVFLSGRDEFVITLSDITEIKKLEKVKKDFVSNVSHELRTPLTSIKGFIETMEEEPAEDHTKYIDIIKRNTERLIAIVNDLLSLSELEDRRPDMTSENVDLEKLVMDVMEFFTPLIKNKGIKLNLTVEPGLPQINGNNLELEQMLSNLIDNAVKYTEKGSISLTLSKVDDGVRIHVSDTGIGIPRKDLKRIFERFYVVDKSRSRISGGTGLGLSIVKHIVLRHRGKIEVESAMGEGTQVTIFLPGPVVS